MPRNVITADRIAVIDFETDPFDLTDPRPIYPFLCVLYFSDGTSQVFWDEDHERLCAGIVDYLVLLQTPLIIYAHNGGRFDYNFFVPYFRGRISYKGASIMRAYLGRHELRDSLHIIPTKLANYKKDQMDYGWMARDKRQEHRQEIIDYCISDCRYLCELLQAFIAENGAKLTIGQASLSRLRKIYTVANLTKAMDARIRPYYRGARVECIRGSGDFKGDYQYFDVNSMYPYVMAYRKHPVSGEYVVFDGDHISTNTFFLTVHCFSHGAFPYSDGITTSFPVGFGTYLVSIWEYQIALKYNLIREVRVLETIDALVSTDFKSFVLPLYSARQKFKHDLKTLEKGSAEYEETARTDLFYKFFLNNAYGKFGQDPSKFKEYFICEPFAKPQKDGQDDLSYGEFPSFMNDKIGIWQRPSQQRESFYNVGTAASITGAARAVLLEALQWADFPLYCDTDAIICRGFRAGHPLEMSDENLGAWSLEKSGNRVVIAGKKDYAFIDNKGGETIRSKGTQRLTLEEMTAISAGEIIVKRNLAPTFRRDGSQFYITRTKKRTA